jgi:hypothetical protein
VNEIHFVSTVDAMAVELFRKPIHPQASHHRNLNCMFGLDQNYAILECNKRKITPAFCGCWKKYRAWQAGHHRQITQSLSATSENHACGLLLVLGRLKRDLTWHIQIMKIAV